MTVAVVWDPLADEEVATEDDHSLMRGASRLGGRRATDPCQPRPKDQAPDDPNGSVRTHRTHDPGPLETDEIGIVRKPASSPIVSPNPLGLEWIRLSGNQA